MIMTTSDPIRGSAGEVTARRAREAALDWLTTTGVGIPGFSGAWLAGSVAWLPERANVPAWSDVDVMIALGDEAPPKIGKLRHQGVLLEISFIAAREVTVEALKANYRVACSFVQGLILADPSGELTRTQAELGSTFWTADAVCDRVRQARAAAETGLTPASMPDSRSQAWQTMWVFPAGLPTHMVLLGMGWNPTVRRRYETAQAAFAQAGQLELYEDLLAATGYGPLSRSDVIDHWEATSMLFDLAAPHSALATSFFASDISTVARPISIDGTRDSIERGFHREALFWLVATQARSLAILEEVAPDLITASVTSQFLSLVNGVGIATPADRAHRSAAILALLPAIEAFSIDLFRSSHPQSSSGTAPKR
jgi:hypothetical protein